jgi:hypothetical protein
MNQVGLHGGLCREPRMPLTGAEREILGHAMEVLGVAAIAQPA